MGHRRILSCIVCVWCLMQLRHGDHTLLQKCHPYICMVKPSWKYSYGLLLQLKIFWILKDTDDSRMCFLFYFYFVFNLHSWTVQAAWPQPVSCMRDDVPRRALQEQEGEGSYQNLRLNNISFHLVKLREALENLIVYVWKQDLNERASPVQIRSQTVTTRPWGLDTFTFCLYFWCLSSPSIAVWSVGLRNEMRNMVCLDQHLKFSNRN